MRECLQWESATKAKSGRNWADLRKVRQGSAVMLGICCDYDKQTEMTGWNTGAQHENRHFNLDNSLSKLNEIKDQLANDILFAPGQTV